MHPSRRFPFDPGRTSLYSYAEIAEVDEAIHQHFLLANAAADRMARASHDLGVSEALAAVLEGLTVVGIMGGHATRREERRYALVARVAHALGGRGFCVLTGGGPGSMEAANLGARMVGHDQAELDQMIERITREDPGALAAELAEAGKTPDRLVSIGVPTWVYGREPSNAFAQALAKVFSQGVRDECMVHWSTHGVLFVPGGPGTHQEIFQHMCANHYSDGQPLRPLAFADIEHWERKGMVKVIRECARGTDYAERILFSDYQDEIVDHFVRWSPR